MLILRLILALIEIEPTVHFNTQSVISLYSYSSRTMCNYVKIMIILTLYKIWSSGQEFHFWAGKAIYIFQWAFTLENLKVLGKLIRGHRQSSLMMSWEFLGSQLSMTWRLRQTHKFVQKLWLQRRNERHKTSKQVPMMAVDTSAFRYNQHKVLWIYQKTCFEGPISWSYLAADFLFVGTQNCMHKN